MFTKRNLHAFQATIHAYFDGKDAEALVAKRAPIYTMEGLARALKCSRSTLLRYEDANYDAPAFCDAVKSARARVAEWTEERLYRAGQHPASPIFSLKNNFGWKDVQTMEHQGAVLMGVMMTDAQRLPLVPALPAVISQVLEAKPIIEQIPSNNAECSALETAALSPVSEP